MDDEAEASSGSAPTARARQRYRESSSPYSRSRPGWIRPWCFACLTSCRRRWTGWKLGLAGCWTDARRGERLIRYQGQMIEALAPAASTRESPRRRSAGWFTDFWTPDPRCAGRSWPPPRRLSPACFGWLARAEALMQLLDPGGNTAVSTAGLSPIDRLSLGIGWFASGDDDAGNRLLNEARETLFLDERLPIRERTEPITAYAHGIGPHRPRRRLEELFQRSRFLVEVKSSTNRYFTPQAAAIDRHDRPLGGDRRVQLSAGRSRLWTTMSF